MDPLKAVELEILADGKPLKLYTDEDDEQADKRMRERYVEAVTGATFKIVVRLTQTFEIDRLGPEDAVRLRCSLMAILIGSKTS